MTAKTTRTTELPDAKAVDAEEDKLVAAAPALEIPEPEPELEGTSVLTVPVAAVADGAVLTAAEVLFLGIVLLPSKEVL